MNPRLSPIPFAALWHERWARWQQRAERPLDALEQAYVRLDEAVAHIAVLEEQLRKERRMFPADGLWWVSTEPGDDRKQRLTYVADLLDPVAFAAIAAHRAAIAQAVYRSWHQYAEHGKQSPRDVADAIIAAVYHAQQDGEHV